MAYGITRVHGGAKPGTFHGGYQLKWFTVEDANTTINFATDNALPESNFEKAVRTIENVASVVVLGTPTSAGFTVGIDQGSYFGRGDNTGAVDNSETTLETALNGALSTTTIAVTAVSLSGKGLA